MEVETLVKCILPIWYHLFLDMVTLDNASLRYWASYWHDGLQLQAMLSNSVSTDFLNPKWQIH